MQDPAFQGVLVADCGDQGCAKEDAAFIASAKQDVAALVEEVEWLRERAESYRRRCDWLRQVEEERRTLVVERDALKEQLRTAQEVIKGEKAQAHGLDRLCTEWRQDAMALKETVDALRIETELWRNVGANTVTMVGGVVKRHEGSDDYVKSLLRIDDLKAIVSGVQGMLDKYDGK